MYTRCKIMPYSSLQYVPEFVSILLPVTFISTYIAAVLQGHVPADFPYISDTGSCLPESAFFGQSLNIIAAILVLCIYIRHRQLLCQNPPYRPQLKLLKAALWSGMLAALGLSMVGNFQLTNLPVFHYIGAFLAFFSGIIYLWIQVFCTRFDPPERFNLNFVRFRWILSCIASVAFCLTGIGGLAAYLIRGGRRTDENFPYGPGYEWFLVSSVSEWVVATALSVYIFTFSRDFRYINMTTPQVTKKKNTQDI